jgi:outer membrane protein TolC
MASLAAAARAQETPAAPVPIAAQERALPINLPAALRLAGATPIDVAVAEERVRAAAAQVDRAHVLWLPTVYVGGDYFRHDGRIQDIVGHVFTTSRSSVMVGAGPGAVFALSDALYAPLAARQVLRAREAEAQAVRNDAMLAVAEAYFNVQQARGELAGAADALRRSDELLRRVEKLAEGLVPAVEVNRARAERSRRRQAVESAYERWQTASAELNRLLRLDPAAVVEPEEPPHLRVDLVDLAPPVDELIPVALTNRPELAAQQALVQATLARLKQEKIRPLVPSVLVRGNATNPAGTLSGGLFGGGVNDRVENFGARHSIDAQVLWELQNLGLGNRALVRERQAENQQALLALFRTQDRVAAEVAQAHAQGRRAQNRAREAEEGLGNAVETAQKTIEGLGQTRRAGELLQLVFRPQEVVAAIQALDQAYRDYYAAVADANRAQFRLYRALGHAASCVPLAERR